MKAVGLALAAAVAVTALVVPVVAADAPVTIGFADSQALLQGYEKTAKSRGELETLAGRLNQRLEMLSQAKLLDEADRKELADLVGKSSQTDQDKERIKALQDKEKALDAELKSLQSKSELTDQEKARQKELQDRSAKADESLAKLLEEYRTDLRGKEEESFKQIREDILKVIEAVAKEKGVTVVLDKPAVLFGGVDITDAVIEKLNGKKK